ncbi:hypothetical protein M3J09_013276 [Ascochyta lentis]
MIKPRICPSTLFLQTKTHQLHVSHSLSNTPFQQPTQHTRIYQHAWLRNCWLHLRRLRLRSGCLQLRQINSQLLSISDTQAFNLNLSCQGPPPNSARPRATCDSDQPLGTHTQSINQSLTPSFTCLCT